ncbi:MAG: S24 family peptidase, partial [Chitinophagales bacterium]|nr:S24 family peptidase [Chitinophagales bacterium]
YMPHLGPGIHIRMKISGDSMHATIKDGDYVIATYQPEPLKTLREGHIYLMIDKDDGVVCKRLYNSAKNTLELESDNDIYKPYYRKITDILALFRVVEVHTTDLRNYYSDTRREINKIWQEIAKLKRKN